MARSSLSEDSLVRLEQYLGSYPYREYSMSKPYFPRTSHLLSHSVRQTPQPLKSTLTFHQLVDHSRNSLTLDRLAYKLRMKSDLNIDTLRETNGHRRRPYQRNQPASSPQNQLTLEVSDVTGSFLPSATTVKPTVRPVPAVTLTTEAVNEDLIGVEGNAVRVGTVDNLLKRFRPVEYQIPRRPTDLLDSPSTAASNHILPADRAITTKPHSQHHERPTRQPQALTEYRFKTPTFPSLSMRVQREATHPPTSNSQTRPYDPYDNVDHLEMLSPRQGPLNSPEQHRQRLPYPTQQSADMHPYDKRIQDSREKSLMRTEKQSFVCNKLTIGDPFTTPTDRTATAAYRLQPTQDPYPPVTTNYIFPPVRPFGYFTKKPTNDDSAPSPPDMGSFSPRARKKHGINKKQHPVSRNVSEMVDKSNSTPTVRIRVDSASTLSDDDYDVPNTTAAVNYDVEGTLLQTTADDDEL